MFRSERMTSVSIICVRKDVETVLETLSSFGEFHIEQAAEGANLAEYDTSIQNVEKSLASINGLTKQLVSEKSNMLDIFRTPKLTRTKITAENWQALFEATSQGILNLKEEVEPLTSSLAVVHDKTSELNHIKGMLTTMEYMDADLEAMEELKLIHVAIASVPHRNLTILRRALAGSPIILHRCYLTKAVDFLCLAMPNKIREDIESILKTHHAELFQIPEELPHDVTKALDEVNNLLKENSEREKATAASLRKRGQENKNRLVSWRETIENVLELLRAKRKILQSGKLATVKGFVPQKQVAKLSEKVHAVLNGKALVLENEIGVIEDPPTMFRHGRFVKPFEEIIRLYGLPHYEEFDPTPVIAVTFPLIFGLMFADVGQGLLLLVGGLTLGTLIKKDQAIKNTCYVLAACGVGAILAGLLFGEFFGIRLFAPLWFDPFADVFTFLIFSLVVGMVQITSGLVIEMVNFMLKRNTVDIAFTSIPKIAFYVGAVYLIATYKLNFAAWLSGPILLALIPFIVLVFGGPVWSAVAGLGRPVETPRERKTLGERFFEGGDFVTRLISNTMSYTRILALLMAHWALMLTTFVIAGLVGSASFVGLLLSAIVIIGGNLFVIALEGLVVFIHTLRLHFYEWFSKFYQGTGTEFTPFRQKFIFTEVVFQKAGKPADSQ